mmetsp:Transcript_6014/g.17394  ORF Transcript_6014/g.17394 Transcript_6014/m.17394 type:complete len:220 (+) Transcript_6014:316-975(+)
MSTKLRISYMAPPGDGVFGHKVLVADDGGLCCAPAGVVFFEELQLPPKADAKPQALPVGVRGLQLLFGVRTGLPGRSLGEEAAEEGGPSAAISPAASNWGCVCWGFWGCSSKGFRKRYPTFACGVLDLTLPVSGCAAAAAPPMVKLPGLTGDSNRCSRFSRPMPKPWAGTGMATYPGHITICIAMGWHGGVSRPSICCLCCLCPTRRSLGAGVTASTGV